MSVKEHQDRWEVSLYASNFGCDTPRLRNGGLSLYTCSFNKTVVRNCPPALAWATFLELQECPLERGSTAIGPGIRRGVDGRDDGVIRCKPKRLEAT